MVTCTLHPHASPSGEASCAAAPAGRGVHWLVKEHSPTLHMLPGCVSSFRSFLGGMVSSGAPVAAGGAGVVGAGVGVGVGVGVEQGRTGAHPSGVILHTGFSGMHMASLPVGVIHAHVSTLHSSCVVVRLHPVW